MTTRIAFGPLVLSLQILLWGCAEAKSPPSQETVSAKRGRIVATLDFDGDSVPNLYDLCPESSEDGTGWFDGCPKPPSEAAPDPKKPTSEKKPVVAEIVGDKIVIYEQILFEFDKSEIRHESDTVVDAVAVILKSHPEIEGVECAGHADARGSATYNQALTRDRAHAVLGALAEREVDASRMSARGYGSTCPLDPTNDEVAQAKNRRVEFVITQRSGVPTGAVSSGCPQQAPATRACLQRGRVRPLPLPISRNRERARARARARFLYGIEVGQLELRVVDRAA